MVCTNGLLYYSRCLIPFSLQSSPVSALQFLVSIMSSHQLLTPMHSGLDLGSCLGSCPCGCGSRLAPCVKGKSATHRVWLNGLISPDLSSGKSAKSDKSDVPLLAPPLVGKMPKGAHRCPCGGTWSGKNGYTHLRTKIHRSWVSGVGIPRAPHRENPPGRVFCDCGGKWSERSERDHKKSKRHRQWVAWGCPEKAVPHAGTKAGTKAEVKIVIKAEVKAEVKA